MKSFWSGFKYKINEAVQEKTSKRSKRKTEDSQAEAGMEQNEAEADKGKISSYLLVNLHSAGKGKLMEKY